MKQNELMKCCPTLVAEYIDEVLLPDTADGHHSAKQIYLEWRDEAMDRLLLAMKSPDFYKKQVSGLDLIDTWIVWSGNKVIAVSYIQEVFDDWE